MVISVSLGAQSYPIILDSGVLARAGEHLALARRVLVVTDSGVPEEYAETTETAVDRVGRKVSTVSERLDMPVTGVLGFSCLACWILVSGVGWLFSRRRMVSYWHGDIGGPMTWLWRLNAGLLPSRTVVFTVTRLVPYMLMWAALILLSWRYACPPLAASGLLG